MFVGMCELALIKGFCQVPRLYTGSFLRVHFMNSVYSKLILTVTFGPLVVINQNCMHLAEEHCFGFASAV